AAGVRISESSRLRGGSGCRRAHWPGPAFRQGDLFRDGSFQSALGKGERKTIMDYFHALEERARFDPVRMGKLDVVRGQTLMAGLNTFEPGQSQRIHAHE